MWRERLVPDQSGFRRPPLGVPRRARKAKALISVPKKDPAVPH